LNNIIQQNCIKFIEKVTKFISGESIKTLVELEEGFKEISEDFIRGTTKAYLEGIDEAVAEDKVGRRKRGLVVERRDEERSIYTRFGEVKYTRAYYWDKRSEEYVHPVDKVAGLESYERVSLSVAADMVNHSAEVSYGQSSRHITDGKISRQTVMNKIRKMHDLELGSLKQKRSVKVLHITADEDHVALQDGRNTNVPLITVYEGVRWVGKNRYECINPRHFSSYGESIENLWLEVSNWIYDSYDEEVWERIYIHGDGAAWMKVGLKYLAKSVHVLDQYHENKAVMSATGAQPNLRGELRDSIKNAERERIGSLVKELLNNAGTEAERDRIIEFRRYIYNNWNGIEVKKHENCGGCCAEGQVSHVLSVRLSSRPMGWCREGLNDMSRLRAYWVNGGQVKPEHLRKDEKLEQYIKKAMKRAKRAFNGIDADELGNIFALKMGKVTPIFRILRGIQHGGITVN
jgi:hypothetical protein